MKRFMYFVAVAAVLAIAGFTNEQCAYAQNSSNEATWVDIGLPSGTLWKSKNEPGLYGYYDATNRFGKGYLPTEEQWQELSTICQWLWMGRGYKVTGPNGKSIYLPAKGWFSSNGTTDGVDEYGLYMSAENNKPGYVGRLYFHMNGRWLGSSEISTGMSVRLVRQK